ncbi:MAG: thiamine phosphate synthase [Parvularculaceae bacterium]
MVGRCHEGLRTRAARLAAAAQALKQASGALAPFSLAFMTDGRRIADPEPVLRALPAGSAVIFRDYDHSRRAAIARRFLSICRGRGVLFLVAGDQRLAAAVGADGVHWPAGGRTADVRARAPGLVSVACHGAADLARARRLGADVALLSPVFPTRSHQEAEHLGPARFLAIAAASPLPVLALGGVDATNAALLDGRNVAGLAAIGAFVTGPPSPRS